VCTLLAASRHNTNKRPIAVHRVPADDEQKCLKHVEAINPLVPGLNPSAQRCLMRVFTGDFAS
jgi:hypothetical protein